MKITDVPVRHIFHISEGDGYPKIRVPGGYVCLRDEIKIPERKFYPTEDAVLSNIHAVQDYFLERFGIAKHETDSIVERLGRTTIS